MLPFPPVISIADLFSASRKDVHFTTPYYHGNIPLEQLVKKIKRQRVGSYLTYAVVQDHTFQYYCLFVSDNHLYTSQRHGGLAGSASPPKQSISPLRRTRLRKTRSPAASPVVSPAVSPESSPRSEHENEKGLVICAAIESPNVSEEFLVKNDCSFPLLRHQQPSTRFVPFLNEHASQKSSPRSSLEESEEDPNYALELIGVLVCSQPAPVFRRLWLTLLADRSFAAGTANLQVQLEAARLEGRAGLYVSHRPQEGSSVQVL